MKYCPVCFTEYSGEVATCPTDNSALKATTTWKPGDTIREYRILEKIGEGGMAVSVRRSRLP